MQLTVPVDAGTGLVTGKLQTKPVKFIKKWGGATPQFLQAHTTGETRLLTSERLSKSADNLAKSVFFNVFKGGPRLTLPLSSRVSLMDLSGRSLHTFKVTGNGELRADELEVPSGLYLIRLSGQKAMILPVHVK